jgi:glutamyl-tRNA reductase
VIQPGPGLVALVAHARQVPANEREAFATLVRNELPERALIFETCHRVEAYLTVGSGSGGSEPTVQPPPGGATLLGEDAARHAIAVAVGRDSVVVGEDQILHQLRESVDAARRTARLDPALDRLFSLALQAGRRARSWRQGPSRSLADVAVAALERRIGSLAGRQILVVGAGRMGRLAVTAATGAGASVVISNRSRERAAALAQATGAGLAPFDPGTGAGRFGGVIVALAGRWTIDPATLSALRLAHTVVIDLSVPPALDRGALTALGAQAISADALALAEEELAKPAAAWLARLDRLVDGTSAEFTAWLDGRASRATAEALIERADREREAELELLWRHRPDLQAEDRAAITGMARHLAQRLLREPLERLGRDSDGTDEQAVRDLFAL